MSAIGYLRKNGIKHTLDVIWQYKIDRLLLRLLRPICLRLPLTDTIVIESHNDFDSNGGAFYDYLIEHGYNERYRIVWTIKNKASKKVALPKNVTRVPLWRPGVRKDWIFLRAKFFTADEDISGKVRPGQRSYYLTHGTFSLKNAAGLVDIPDSVDHILLGSENVREIETTQFRPQPSTQFLCIGFPLHDRLLMPAVPQLDKVRPDAHFSRVVIWMPTARPSGTSDAACADTPTHSASATAAVTAKRRKKCGCFRKKSPLCACSISMPGFGENSGGTFLLDCLPERKCLRRRAYDVPNQFW